MADQLLATFYVQSPEFLYVNVTVTSQIQQQWQTGGSWSQDSNLRVVVTAAHYDEPESGNTRYRYKIDLFRVEQSQYDYNVNQTVYYYGLHKAGTYRRRLTVTFNSSFILERMIYITIQPDLHVYRERIEESGARSQEDLVITTEMVI